MTGQPPRHQRPTRLKKLLFGAPYYPEHWDEPTRQSDPQRMAAAGVNVVRMAEFAWDRIEPRRGELDFALFDQTVAALGAVGIDTILCTPTATPPAWLTAGHEDWMRVDESGRRMDHGSRQHVCTNNERFRAESRRITAAMAEHYAGNPHVVGWQTDNEFYCHISQCHCPSCRDGFRAWLRERYKTIGRLNAAWGTAFWAQTYDDFAQVPLPYPESRPAYPNPSHELDYYRYLSDSITEFQRQQVEILRAADARWWITHNGIFNHIDYWRFSEDLDFLSVDIYPGFGAKEPMDACGTAFGNQRCRSASGGYIIPEQQGGAGGQKPYLHPTPKPGQMRLWAWQGIAHGADGVLHFRWRTCRFGAEEYWNGILDHDNVPRRRYEEFALEGRELAAAGPRILGTVGEVKAGVLIETEQEDAWRTLGNGLPSPGRQQRLGFRELWRRRLPAGLVQSADSFDGLELLVLPSMPLMDAALTAKLRAFVEAGGTLVVTARSATRDRDNQVIAQTPPGLLAELCGVVVEEFGAEEAGSGLTMLVGDKSIELGAGYEVLSLRGAEPLAVWQASAEYGPSAAHGQPAIAAHRVGRGEAIYVGTYLSGENAQAVFDLVLARTALKGLAEAADGVEVTARHGQGRRLVFVLNHHGVPQKVTSLPRGRDLLSGRPCEGELTLEPFGVAVIEQE